MAMGERDSRCKHISSSGEGQVKSAGVVPGPTAFEGVVKVGAGEPEGVGSQGEVRVVGH